LINKKIFPFGKILKIYIISVFYINSFKKVKISNVSKAGQMIFCYILFSNNVSYLAFLLLNPFQSFVAGNIIDFKILLFQTIQGNNKQISSLKY